MTNRGRDADLATELRVGIDTGQLRLWFQPIVATGTGQPVGVESLVRWQHPARGLLGPAEFMEVAETTGLVIPLGQWVLEEACRVAVDLAGRADGALTVGVNLSGRQLSDLAFVDQVRSTLHAQGCPAGHVVFEVTETAQARDLATVIDALRQLQDLGAGVALDDFGTGYSSLIYLKHVSADDLKIDRSFIQGLGTDRIDTAIVTSLIRLAHELNVRCVAKGVETVEQLELLDSLGCNFAQGYLFSRPLDERALGAWLDQRVHLGELAVPEGDSYRPAVGTIVTMNKAGASRQTIAAALNADGSRTVRGVRWSVRSVGQVLGDAVE